MKQKQARLSLQSLKRYAEKNFDLPVSDNIQNMLSQFAELNIQVGKLVRFERDKNCSINYSSPVEYRAELDRIVNYCLEELSRMRD